MSSLSGRSVAGKMDYGGVRDLQGKRQMPAVQGIREDPPLILFLPNLPDLPG